MFSCASKESYAGRMQQSHAAENGARRRTRRLGQTLKLRKELAVVNAYAGTRTRAVGLRAGTLRLLASGEPEALGPLRRLFGGAARGAGGRHAHAASGGGRPAAGGEKVSHHHQPQQPAEPREVR